MHTVIGTTVDLQIKNLMTYWPNKETIKFLVSAWNIAEIQQMCFPIRDQDSDRITLVIQEHLSCHLSKKFPYLQS